MSPFVVGRRYRVVHEFTSLRDAFRAGEILVFRSEAYSRYDGITGHFFSQPGVAGLRSWDVPDEQDAAAAARTLFVEVPITPDEARAIILAQCEPDSGVGEPQTFLGAFRPYRRVLPHDQFHSLMSALRALSPRLASGVLIDRQLVAALWTICHLTRMWALVDGSMLRRNNLIDADELKTLERWHDMLSYAVMILLESGDAVEAFSEYDNHHDDEAG